MTAPEEKMMVRRGDVNFAGADQLAVPGEMRGQERVAVEDGGKLARIGPDVKHAQERGRDLAGESGKQFFHRLDASVRGTDNHDRKVAGGSLLHVTQRQ